MSTEPALSPLGLADHLSALVEQRLGKLTQSLKASHRERSVDAVHDLRVASRRLRAFGVTFGELLGDKLSGRLEQQLRRVTRAVGALRDLDVQVGMLEERVVATSHELERAALEHLLLQLAERRAPVAAKAEKRLHKLDEAALSRLVRRAAGGVITELASVQGQRGFATALLARLVADAAEQVPSTDGGEQPERLHRLRIDCKEIRYALEFFEPILGSHFQLLYDRATALQNLLGTYHDLTTLGEVMAERGGELERKGHHTLGVGVKRAEDAFTDQRQEVLARFRNRGFDPSWWRERLNDALAPG